MPGAVDYKILGIGLVLGFSSLWLKPTVNLWQQQAHLSWAQRFHRLQHALPFFPGHEPHQYQPPPPFEALSPALQRAAKTSSHGIPPRIPLALCRSISSPTADHPACFNLILPLTSLGSAIGKEIRERVRTFSKENYNPFEPFLCSGASKSYCDRIGSLASGLGRHLCDCLRRKYVVSIQSCSARIMQR